LAVALRLAIKVLFECTTEVSMLPFTPSARTRLLLVEDNQEQRELCASALRLSGFPVMTASHAGEALRIMAEDAMDVAILDYEMPGVNGCALAHEIRTKYGHTRIVLYSGTTGIPASELASVDAFVQKGNGPAQLIGRILELSRDGNTIQQRRASLWCVPEPCL
jgi:CheY-like chemotaxis protein